MCPHDVNHRVTSKFPKMVGADDRIVVATPHIIDTQFEINELVDIRTILDRPVHAAANATERKSSFGAAPGQLLESLQHPVLIETAAPNVSFRVGQELVHRYFTVGRCHPRDRVQTRRNR